MAKELDLKSKIVFEDQHLLVLNKPAGALSQGDSSGDDSVVDWLRRYWGRRYVGLVHRLDRNTSGLMVIAKRSKAAKRLSEDLKKKLIHREYLAWVHGTLSAPETWENYLLKNERENKVKTVSKNVNGAKAARMSVTPLAQLQWESSPLTLLRCQLQTGRSHQIRVQAAANEHPLLGEAKYSTRQDGFERPALHSRWLTLTHPMSKETLQFVGDLPHDFLKIDDSVSMIQS